MELDLAGLQMPGQPEQSRPGEIVLRPLERGFGHTLGNTMRRILLSSLRGSAVWAFRSDGVLHEHQTIPGVVEDVHQVIKNLKALVLKLDEDVDEAVLELRADKSGSVTARSIREHPAVQVINPDHHILELQDERELRIELYVNKGRGFVLAEQHPLPRGLPADLVRIDAIYNPVRRANFVVEETRVGQRTDFDRLVLEIETNGSLAVDAAVRYAARLAIEHFSFLAGARPEWGTNGDTWAETPEETASTMRGEEVPQSVRDILNQPIDEIAELTIRSRNSLQKRNILTVRDLVQHTEKEMLDIDNFGKKSLQEINEFLSAHNLRFGVAFEEGDEGKLHWRDRGADDKPASDETPEEGGESGS